MGEASLGELLRTAKKTEIAKPKEVKKISISEQTPAVVDDGKKEEPLEGKGKLITLGDALAGKKRKPKDSPEPAKAIKLESKAEGPAPAKIETAPKAEEVQAAAEKKPVNSKNVVKGQKQPVERVLEAKAASADKKKKEADIQPVDIPSGINHPKGKAVYPEKRWNADGGSVDLSREKSKPDKQPEKMSVGVEVFGTDKADAVKNKSIQEEEESIREKIIGGEVQATGKDKPEAKSDSEPVSERKVVENDSEISAANKNPEIGEEKITEKVIPEIKEAPKAEARELADTGELEREMSQALLDYMDILDAKSNAYKGIMGFLGSRSGAGLSNEKLIENDSDVIYYKKIFDEKLSRYQIALVDNAEISGASKIEKGNVIKIFNVDRKINVASARVQVKAENLDGGKKIVYIIRKEYSNLDEIFEKFPSTARKVFMQMLTGEVVPEAAGGEDKKSGSTAAEKEKPVATGKETDRPEKKALVREKENGTVVKDLDSELKEAMKEVSFNSSDNWHAIMNRTFFKVKEELPKNLWDNLDSFKNECVGKLGKDAEPDEQNELVKKWLKRVVEMSFESKII